MRNVKLLGFIIIAFIAGTITSGAIASADKEKDNNPFSAIVNAINNLTDAIKNKQTTVTVNAQQGPPGTSVTVTPEPPGPNCANGGVKLTSVSGINYVCNGGSTQTCPAGQSMCSGACSTLNSDNNNCGTCGHACGAGAVCSAGVCTCSAGQVACQGGVCSNLSTDTHNCGACGTVCNTANAVSSCTAGTCTISTCNAGFANCDGSPANGCETNTQSNTNNCGACGVVCSSANAVSSCTAGACNISTCNTGFANCDQNAANGCEINTNTDTHNCGACGTVCPGTSNGTPACLAGTCGIHCNFGFHDCGTGTCTPVSQLCQ